MRKAASGILDEAGRGGETTLNRVVATLQAAAASEEGRELLARGRLTGDLEATGFELLTPLTGRPESTRQAPAPKRGGKARVAPPKRASQAAERRQLERLEQAGSRLRDAQASAKAVEAELRKAQQDAEQAGRELTRAKERLRKTQASADRARKAVDQAEKGLREAERKR